MTEKLRFVVSTHVTTGEKGIWDRVADEEPFYDDMEDIKEVMNNIHWENIQLKATMKEVTELLEEEVDLFSDKATEHDINAYVELKEFDNKDAYYMAISTKRAIKMLKEVLDD